MAERTVRVVLTGDATSLIAAAAASRRALMELSNTNVGRVGQGLREVGTAATRAGRETQSAFAQIKNSIAGQVGIGNLATLGVIGAFRGIKDAIGSTVKAGMDYQDTLLNMGAVTHSSSAVMDQVSQKARQLGKDITIPGASATDAAKAMTELAKGGLSVASSMTAAKGTLQLAAAASIDASAAAEIQVNTLQAFHLGADQATRVADVLANVANKASGNMTDFSDALKAAGPTSHAFGTSIEDTTTVLGLFANAGLKGEYAGTLMKTMMIHLAAPTKPATAALKELGVTAYDASGKFEGWAKITDQLRAAHANLTTQEYNSATATAFGNRGIQGASVLGLAAADAYSSMSTAIHTAGTASDVATAKMSGLSGAFENVKNQVQDIQLQVFDSFSGGLTTAVNDFAGGLPGMVDAIMGGIGYLGTKLGEFFGPIIDGVAGLVHTAMPYITDFVSSIKDGAVTAIDALAPLGKSIAELFKSAGDTGILNALGVALDGVGTAFSGVMKVLAPIVGAIGGVVGWFAQLPGPVRAAALAFGAMVLLKGPIAALFTAIKSGFDSLALRAMTAADSVAAAGGIMKFSMASVATGARAMWAAIGGWVTIGLSALVTVFTLFSSTMADSAKNADSAKQGVEGLVGALQQSNGVFDETARAAALAALKQQAWGESSTDLTTYAGNLGVKLTDLVDGMTGVAGASDRVEAAYQRQRAALQKVIDEGARGVGDTRARKVSAQAAEDARASLVILNQQHDAYGQLTSAAAGAGQAAADANAAIKGGGDAASGVAPDYGFLNGLLGGVAENLGGVAAGFTGVETAAPPATTATDDFKTALDDAKSAASAADTATQFLNQSLLELAGSNLTAEQQTRLNAAAMRDIGGSARDAAAAHDKVTEAQKKLDDMTAHLGGTLNGEEASASNLVVTQADLDAATRALADAKDAESAASDKQADANDKAGESARNMAGAAGAAALANGTMTDAINAAKKVLGEQRTKFIESQSAADQASGAAEKLADKQGLIPENVDTAYIQQGMTKALNDVDELARKLNGLDNKQIHYSVIGGQLTVENTELSRGGKLATRADGGPISGIGGPRQDNIPIMASNGEYVVNAASYAKHAPLVHAINADRYANGGLIGRVHNQSGRPQSQSGPNTIPRGTATTTFVPSFEPGGMSTIKVTPFSIEQLLAMQATATGFNSSQDPSSFGWVRAANQQPFSWNGQGATVAGGTQGLWTALLDALNPTIPGGVTSIGGFEDRNNVNNPGVPSFHAYGLAMDVNAPQNPNGVSAASIQGQYGAIPIGIAEATAARLGMLWGGDFTGTPDPMHFEIHVPPNGIGAGGGTFKGSGGQVGGLDAEQTSNAEAIASVAISRGLGRSGVLVGIVTAATESTLRNVAHGDAMGPSSTGLFQQMPPWGPYSVRMSPTGSAGLFYDALTRIPGWQGMSIPMQAQSVEQSEFSDGSNYASNMQWANSIVTALGYPDSNKINGRQAFDNGGLLQPGWTQVFNGLGKPEKVFTDQQFSAMANGGSAGTQRIIVEFRGDGPITQGMADTAAYTVNEAMGHLATAINRGRLQPTS